MYTAEYWDEEESEYVSEVFRDEEACRDWCLEHGVPYYYDEDENVYHV